jgi:RHS repeat-associated protein
VAGLPDRFVRGHTSQIEFDKPRRAPQPDHDQRQQVTSVELPSIRIEFDPFGRPTAVQGLLASSSGFTGHRYSRLGALVVSPSRPYDPNTGRWISEDPLGLADGPNRYAYAQNAPTTTTDPTGELSARVTVNDPRGLMNGGLDASVGTQWAICPVRECTDARAQMFSMVVSALRLRATNGRR